MYFFLFFSQINIYKPRPHYFHVQKCTFFSPFVPQKFERSTFRNAKKVDKKPLVDGFLPSNVDEPIWLHAADHCFVFQHRCPLNGAFFISRYISFNPRVVQRMSPSQILRGEPYFSLSGSLPGPVSAEILRLREDATTHKIELKRRIRADFTTTTMCRKYSAILHFSPSPDFKSDLTSKA